jgi:hypothetical protein
MIIKVLDNTRSLTGKKIKQKLGKTKSFQLNPKTAICPKLKGSPKTHKRDVQLRPIADFTGSPSYKWA